MGGVVTTPVINHPEVAIVGVNKMMVRPVWDGTQFIPRKMMNLSSQLRSSRHRRLGRARFVQRIKTLLETPALIFVEELRPMNETSPASCWSSAPVPAAMSAPSAPASSASTR